MSLVNPVLFLALTFFCLFISFICLQCEMSIKVSPGSTAGQVQVYVSLGSSLEQFAFTFLGCCQSQLAG